MKLSVSLPLCLSLCIWVCLCLATGGCGYGCVIITLRPVHVHVRVRVSMSASLYDTVTRMLAAAPRTGGARPQPLGVVSTSRVPCHARQQLHHGTQPRSNVVAHRPRKLGLMLAKAPSVTPTTGPTHVGKRGVRRCLPVQRPILHCVLKRTIVQLRVGVEHLGDGHYIKGIFCC